MTGLPAHKRMRFTWEDYRTWPDDERWEIIDGEAFAMSPSAGQRHQWISIRLATAFVSAFRGKTCLPFAAPFDVKLSDGDIVQPDLLVVCDRSKLKPTHVEGAPDLVVEILSPSSVPHDRVRKLRLYAAHGVPEYWIITPYPSVVEVFVLADGSYRVGGSFGKEDTLASPTFPDLVIDLKDVFSFTVPPEERIEEIRESTPPYAAARSAR